VLLEGGRWLAARTEEAWMNGRKLLGLVAVAAAMALGTTTAGANLLGEGTARAGS
jgi:hypothetical protein